MAEFNQAQPFTSNLDYLSAAIGYLQQLARQRLLEAHLEMKRSGMDEDRHTRRELDQLVGEETTSVSALQQLLDSADNQAQQTLVLLKQRAAATVQQEKVRLPLEELVADHGLSEFEKLTLLAVLGPTLDRHFKRWIEAIGDSRGVRVSTILDLLCTSLPDKIKARKHFVYNGKLLGNGLLDLSYRRNDLANEDDFMSMELSLPRRVSSLILGEYDVDDQLVSFSSVIDPQVELDQVVLPHGKKEEVLQLFSQRERYMEERSKWGFDRILPYGRGTVALFHGPSGTGKTMLAHALAKATGHRLLQVDIRKIAKHSKRDFEDDLELVFREARLQHAIVFFDEADEMFSDRTFNSAMPTLLRELEKLDGVAILATNRKHALDEGLERRILYKLEFEVPTPELRADIWRNHLPPEAPLAEDVDIARLADEFEFAGGFIKNAVLTAVNRALRRTGNKRRITHEDLRSSAALQRRNKLDVHTDKIAPRVGLAEVVLPDNLAVQVHEFVEAARKRSTVYSSWGFGKKMSLGKALSALFTGESGVGKTMAAEAVACELGQNLYPVQLSALVSKYVGETEKNLSRVFEAAREAQAVLFFDEADALFSSRLEDGSTQAHFVNQQINCLLGEIEKYDGIVILSTNRPDAFDQAFERRIRYRLHFPRPAAAAREKIWRTMMPEEAPVADDVDYAALAADYEFTGGTIRNIVLRAAFTAAINSQKISHDVLRRSADEEQGLKKERPIGFGAVV